MKTNIAVEVRPFEVPGFVAVGIAGDTKEASALPLSVLDSNDLDRLCRQFRNAVFEKAGKEQPPEQARA